MSNNTNISVSSHHFVTK